MVKVPKPVDKKKDIQKKNGKNIFIWLLILLAAVYILRLGTLNLEGPVTELAYGDFYRSIADGRVSSAVLKEDTVDGRLSDGERFTVNIPEGDPELIQVLRSNVPDFKIVPPKTFLLNVFYSFVPTILFIGLLWFLFYRGASQGGGKLLSFGKSRAKLMPEGKMQVTFEEVAGVDEAKEELKEVIEFLQDPKKFQRLGGKMPKGVLLIGPPGCGKTLLAKAVSGEAGVPFFSISGSDFVEMFVGVGASRVRDLFEQAKRTAKQTQKGAIVFIDEIDAVGRQRFAGIGGGHDEREQTLNALLVEMDGFDTQEGVILTAATNRPDVLDPALLRPGRFDRIIVVDRPDIVGREAILKVHAKDVKLDKDVDLNKIAQQTPGFSGADLANLINEAALLAARKDKKSVMMEDLQEATERIIAGPEKKSRVINKDEKARIAHHEAGHAVLSLLIPEADPMHKVTILPRGMALGYTMTPPTEDRHIYTKKKLMSKIIVALGGRVSEELVFDEVSSGAHEDLKTVTETARTMVTRFGMSDKLGHLVFGKPHENIFLGRDLGEERDYSNETARIIDEEVKKLVDECYDIAKKVLTESREELDLLAARLLEKEVVHDVEAKEILKLETGKNDTAGTKKSQRKKVTASDGNGKQGRSA
ncbi:MAG: ATP-dependent zinc metalloprotease FtsH [Candidatus Omnitrophica bacterium]|nr:ATP-dependent zinc metalloprotease FtsH [Candidatus Omnitrophota bacterium]